MSSTQQQSGEYCLIWYVLGHEHKGWVRIVLPYMLCPVPVNTKEGFCILLASLFLTFLTHFSFCR